MSFAYNVKPTLVNQASLETDGEKPCKYFPGKIFAIGFKAFYHSLLDSTEIIFNACGYFHKSY